MTEADEKARLDWAAEEMEREALIAEAKRRMEEERREEIHFDTPEQALKRYWGYDSFRPAQVPVVQSVMAGRDTLALLPTGGGKSITFQAPTMARRGMCLVITPLIALMKDQVEHLMERRMMAAAIYSGMTDREIDNVIGNAVRGAYKFLYVSPERLDTVKFKTYLPSFDISLIAVDEAHCISQWGYDFRPAYMKIAAVRERLPKVPVLALTATATPDVAEDICECLKFKRDPQTGRHNIIQSSFYRPNLTYVVRKTTDKISEAFNVLNGVRGSSIVYCRSREKVREIAKALSSRGISADFYHAGLTDAQKTARQEQWTKGGLRVMVATNAFGMGIDKPDVRTVIHYEAPDNLESYFQEAGRAGRDGLQSYAVLLYTEMDFSTLNRNLHTSFPSKDFVRQVYDELFRHLRIAIGEGTDMTFSFDLEKFCINRGLNFTQVQAALTIIEQSGYVKFEKESFKSSVVKFIVKRDELYDEKYKDVPPFAQTVMEALMRTYTGLFADYVRINEIRLAKESGLWNDPEMQDKVYQALKVLRSWGIIDYIPSSQTARVAILSRRVEMEKVRITKEAYEERKERATYRLENMVHYILGRTNCRSRMLLNYFGERKSEGCGRCDVCIALRKGTIPMGGGVIYEELHRNVQAKLIARNGEATIEQVRRMFPHRLAELETVLADMMKNGEIRVAADGHVRVGEGVSAVGLGR